MTITVLSASDFGLEALGAGGDYRYKFFAIGEHLIIADFRRHRDLVRASLLSILADLYPADLTSAIRLISQHPRPVVIGHITLDGRIECCTEDLPANCRDLAYDSRVRNALSLALIAGSIPATTAVA